ncbi:MAG TPA: hypothetical protein DCQ31_17870 [Bacteroidales bacterium]|nr:hypothetical protein [Bacteroidales bacterium]
MKGQGSAKIWIAVSVVILLALVWALYDRNVQIEKQEDLVSELEKTTSDKMEVTHDLKELWNQYESLKTNNDSLNQVLGGEQQRIAGLLEELKNVKYSNNAKIEQYKKEIGTLRNIMRSYVVQIDSLNTRNQELIAENYEVKKEFRQERNKNQELSQIADSLNVTVTKASVVKAISLSAMGVNDRDKENSKARKLDKLKVCFTLAENDIARKGLRDVYIRIAGPDTEVLRLADNDLFSFEGQELVYSAKRQVNYSGKAQEVCMYFKPTKELKPGSYVADIFSEGAIIGQVTFVLK